MVIRWGASSAAAQLLGALRVQPRCGGHLYQDVVAEIEVLDEHSSSWRFGGSFCVCVCVCVQSAHFQFPLAR